MVNRGWLNKDETSIGEMMSLCDSFFLKGSEQNATNPCGVTYTVKKVVTYNQRVSLGTK